MSSYQPRQIKFKELIQQNGWRIKTYIISKNGDDENPVFYKHVLANLPVWLNLKNGFNDVHEHLGFLVLHLGTEGIFSIINWWVGANMLNTHVFLTKYDQLDSFQLISGKGLAPCVWELEIINYERIALMRHMLKPDKPHTEGYLSDIIAKEPYFL
jgi:hypothetical protein